MPSNITWIESEGKPDAKNPRSSALGLGQFVNRTWLEMIRRLKPELARGKSDAEILAMRTNPALSQEMTDAYAEENQARLRRAGVPVTPTSTYLMHFAGPGGGVKLLKADPNTPVESILDDHAIQANPFLRGKTASWVIAWANKKVENAATSRPGAASPRAPWDTGSKPVPSLAQTQAVEPAFGATSWPQRPVSLNVLSTDAARRIAGAPSTAPIPFVDGTTRAQQALDNALPAPGAAPWDLSDRFSNWRGFGGAFGPASSSGSSGLGRTGDGTGLAASNEQTAQVSADPSALVQRGTTAQISGGTLAIPPPVRFPLEALLAPDSDRRLGEWASAPRGRSMLSAKQGAAIGGPADPTTSVAATDPSAPDRTSVGGLLGLIQDYLYRGSY